MLQAMQTLSLLAIFAGCCILVAAGCQDAGAAPQRQHRRQQATGVR